MRRFDQELRTVLDIFNDAWAGNWNFLPMSPAEVRHLGASLKPLLRPEFVVIGEVEGEPAAMTVTYRTSTRRSPTSGAGSCRSAG